jgi:hypothetical protein
MFKRKNNKPADVVIGHIVLNNDCALRDNRAGMDNVINHFQAGISIGIGRAVTTLAGRSYRIANTTHWIMDSDCVADNAAISFAADNVDPIVRGGFVIQNTITPAMLNDVNRFTNVLNPDKIKNVSGKTLTAKKSVANPLTNNNNSKSKSRTMDKSALKSVINGLTPGQVVGITFVGDKAHLSRDWTVVKVRTGKGKGGSKLLELVDGARNTIVTGTPESSYILNMTVNGSMHGFSSEADLPVVYETNAGRATELKEAFKSLVGAEGDRRVSIQSTITDLTGTFIVTRGTQLRGRGGQVRLDLERVGSGEKVEVWSLRHSGVISSFTIMSDSES